MDHHDLQVVSNMYQISVYILTVGVVGMKEPGARWTHVLPDRRLQLFSTEQSGRADMWLMHEDNIHFDLIITKESLLTKDANLEQTKDTTKNSVKEDILEDKNGPGYMGWVLDDVDDVIENVDHKKEYEKKVQVLKKDFDDLKEKFDSLKSDYEEYIKNETKNAKKLL